MGDASPSASIHHGVHPTKSQVVPSYFIHKGNMIHFVNEMQHKYALKVAVDLLCFWCKEREISIFRFPLFPAKNAHISLELYLPTCNHNTKNMRKKSQLSKFDKARWKWVIFWRLYRGAEPIPKLPYPWGLRWGKGRNTYLFILFLGTF